jgi:beta-glucosidase
MMGLPRKDRHIEYRPSDAVARITGIADMGEMAASPPLDDDLLQFGRGFVWGASTASYQIEGAAAEDGRSPSIWDVFAHTPGRVRNGDTGDVACDHYHRSDEDIALLARAGFSAYRFSTSWSRILPDGTGAINDKGVAFYDRLVDRLLERGITPWLCLFHWDLPACLQARGGWLNRDIATWFAEYASAVARRLGDRVKHWIMLNEAVVHAIFGHGTGIHAPGLTGWESLIASLHHQNLAQGHALDALRSMRGDLRLGTVMTLQPVRAHSDRAEDRDAAARLDALWNRARLDPLFKANYPDLLAGYFAPLVHDGDLAAINRPVDFLGLNYYSPLYAAYDADSLAGIALSAPPEGTPVTGWGWPIVPEGLTEQLIELRDRYGNPAVYITENGGCFDDPVAADGTVHDADRIAYLRGHLQAAHAALAAGSALRGYFVWSLLDNFEWAEGYSRRFGIVHVDYATLARTPKASFHWLADQIRRQR